MTTTIRLTRRVPFSNSDALREDAALAAESTKLAAWLAAREIDVVTMSQVVAFVQTEHAAAALQRSAVYYSWVWDPKEDRWILVCFDHGVISYELGDSSPAIEIQIDIAARY